jgi:hypothetical protein
LNSPRSSWKITLLDITGRTIKSVTNENIVPISELSAGMYFVRIEYGDKAVTKKVVKQ